MQIFRIDDLFNLEKSSLLCELILFISFIDDHCCLFVLLETKSKKALIIGDVGGGDGYIKDPLPVTKILNENGEELFQKQVRDNTEQNFKRYEHSA